MFIASANSPRHKLHRMTGESRSRPVAGPERNELLRDLVKAIRATDFGGNLSAMGRALRMESTATLAEFVSGEKGAGMKLIDALVAYTGRTLDQIYASGGDLAKLREAPPPPAPAPIKGRSFGELPDWPELLAKARVLRPGVPDAYWTKLASTDVWVDGDITVAIVCDMAEFLLRHR